MERVEGGVKTQVALKKWVSKTHLLKECAKNPINVSHIFGC